ncbi:MAG: hypothetical protein RI894_1564 [Bacteroidota bacterium]|jgi:hypothetical protein
MNFLKNIKNISLSLILAGTMMSFISIDTHTDPPVKLPAGTSILLTSVQRLSSDSLVFGQIVDFKVIADVKVGDKTVIPAGAIAKGEVSLLEHAGFVGKPGQIQIRIKSVEDVNGKKIPLMAPLIIRKGDDLKALSIILGILISLFFLLLMGMKAVVARATVVEAKVEKDTDIE